MEEAKRYEIANDLRTNFLWLKANLEALGVTNLLNMFNSEKLDKDAAVTKHAINSSKSILEKRPSALAYQLYGRLGRTLNGRLADLVGAAITDKSFLLWC